MTASGLEICLSIAIFKPPYFQYLEKPTPSTKIESLKRYPRLALVAYAHGWSIFIYLQH